ncbi:hypothetical protein NEFER01_1444 [Nematocida sp. LUAm1]|nr:hypothetical protein NEFER02_1650 [Nematocida sp. LUAm2]KAI5178277.1 hypothetical protein NEFER01_1444 [Nematocida sp. LUAm1]
MEDAHLWRRLWTWERFDFCARYPTTWILFTLNSLFARLFMSFFTHDDLPISWIKRWREDSSLSKNIFTAMYELFTDIVSSWNTGGTGISTPGCNTYMEKEKCSLRESNSGLHGHNVS